MINPSKHIRKYFFDTLNNKVVNGEAISIHDYRVPTDKDAYILMINQSMVPARDNKCDILAWDAVITLDIVTIYNNIAGSRVFADDIMEMVMTETQNITVDNFSVERVERTYPDDIHLMTSTQAIFRKIIQYELKLTEK